MTYIEEIKREIDSINGKIRRRNAKILLNKKRIKDLTNKNNQSYNLATEADIVIAESEIKNLELEITVLKHQRDTELMPIMDLYKKEIQKMNESQPGDEY